MRPRTAIRSLLCAALLLALVAPVAAMADADNDIGGAATVGIGQSAEGHVDAATDPVDVWAIPLVAGEEVTITVEPTANGDGDALFLAAGITSLTQSDSFGIVTMPVKQSGTLLPLTYRFEQVYTPTRSANYYVSVTCDGAPLSYRISVRRTSSPPITTPDSNDIPGIGLGVGSFTGIVDGRTDKNDLYRVRLFAGRPVTLRLRAANLTKGSAWLHLLDPDSSSVVKRTYYTPQYNGESMIKRADYDEEAVMQFVPPRERRLLLVGSVEHGLREELHLRAQHRGQRGAAGSAHACELDRADRPVIDPRPVSKLLDERPARPEARPEAVRQVRDRLLGTAQLARGLGEPEDVHGAQRRLRFLHEVRGVVHLPGCAGQVASAGVPPGLGALSPAGARRATSPSATR